MYRQIQIQIQIQIQMQIQIENTNTNTVASATRLRVSIMQQSLMGSYSLGLAADAEDCRYREQRNLSPALTPYII